jgi:hypothetical protein
MEWTLEDVERLLSKISGDFYRTHSGLTYQEIAAEAYYHFVLAYRTYDKSKKTKFSTWATFKVWKGLQQAMRKKIQRDQRASLGLDGVPDPPAREVTFDMGDFLGSLSCDARHVAGLVLESGIDVRLAIAERGNNTPRNVRGALRDVLKDMGWTKARVVESFAEIRKALS